MPVEASAGRPLAKAVAKSSAQGGQWLDAVNARVSELLSPLRTGDDQPRSPARECEQGGRAAQGVFRSPSPTPGAGLSEVRPPRGESEASAGRVPQPAPLPADPQREESLQLLQPPPGPREEDVVLRPEPAAGGQVVLARTNAQGELLPWLHRWPLAPCEARLLAAKAALGPVLADVVGEHVFDTAGYLVAFRWPLVGVRPLERPPHPGPFPHLLPEEAEAVQGPQRFQWFHGTHISRLGSIGRDGRLRGISSEEGGAGEQYIFARGWSGIFCSMRAASFIKECFGSSKSPEGIVLGCKGFCRYLPLWGGGHARESAIVHRGLAVHNKRSRQWVIPQGDAELADLYIVVD